MDDAERKRKYAQEKLTVFELRFSKDKDADILARLETVDSKQGYMRMLIKNDLIQKGIISGNLESYDMIVHKGRDKTAAYNVRANLKLVTNGPDQPIIDYLNACKSKIDYIRGLIRADIDSGGNIAEKITTPKSFVDVETVRPVAERTAKLLESLSVQDRTQRKDAQAVIDALNKWIADHK